MKIVCEKKLLNEYTDIVLKTVSSKSPQKALECILFEAVADGFVMSSYNMEMGTRTALIKANVEKEGAVALDAKLFADIIKKMPEGEITIDCADTLVTHLKNKKAKFKIVGLNAENFPSFPDYEEDKFITVKQEDLKELIRMTIFSIAVEYANPVFTGGYLEYKDNYLKLVGIDGYRIAYAQTLLKEENTVSAIVPLKALNEISKLLNKEKGEVKIIFSLNHIVFKTKEYMFISRVLNGAFFNYEQSFKVEHETKVTVRKDEFISCLERCVIISYDIKAQPVILNIADNKIKISAQSEMGSLNEEVEVYLEGEPLEISFNPKYLLESFRAINEEEVNMFFKGPISACIIKSDENPDYKYFILPLKV